MTHIVSPMASGKRTTYPQSEHEVFTAALRKVLQVSHCEMQERLAAEKKAKASKPRPSSRASRGKD